MTAALVVSTLQLAQAASTSGTGAASTAKSSPSPSASPNGNSQGNNGNGVGNGGSSGTQANSHTIVVTGAVSGAPAPGHTAVLNVSVDNSKNQAIYVRTVNAAVTAVTSAGNNLKPTCLKTWYQISSFSGSQYVAAGATALVPLTITFLDNPTVNQDNCKGATYSFSYTATADQA
ncbi:MAG: hypothetical protein JJD92_06225 [Frankiaceae bacterium]|nr:hypothetical protein [Frankiaceae bacterium]